MGLCVVKTQVDLVRKLSLEQHRVDVVQLNGQNLVLLCLESHIRKGVGTGLSPPVTPLSERTLECLQIVRNTSSLANSDILGY